MTRALWQLGAVALLAAAPPLISALGEAWWWTVVAAAAAAATVWTKLLEDRLTRRDQRREESARNLLAGAVGGGLLRVRDVTDPVVLGAHRPHDYDEGPPPYVRRAAQPAVLGHLAPGNFVLVVGDPLSGKTRLAYETVRAALPDHRLVAPDNREVLATAIDAAGGSRGVLWLDDLERFFGPGGLTVAAVLRVAPGIIVATLRRNRLESLMEGESRRVLEMAHHVPLERRLTEDELVDADEQRWHPGIDDGLTHADDYGLAEYLAAYPAVCREWVNAWSPGAHPRGAALVATAANLCRAGFGDVLPRSLLSELHTYYLEERGGPLLRPENIEAAWEWACEPRNATMALLQQADGGHVRVFPTVVDQLSPESRKAATTAAITRVLESRAVRVTYVSQQLVPVPLQSPLYRGDIYGAEHTGGERRTGYTYDDVLDHGTAVLRPNGPKIRLFLGECAFRHRIGGHQGMAQQLAHLRELTRRHAVEVRMLPRDFFPGIEVAQYSFIEFRDADPVVRYSTLVGDIFRLDHDEVEACRSSIEYLTRNSPSIADSRAVIDETEADFLAHT